MLVSTILCLKKKLEESKVTLDQSTALLSIPMGRGKPSSLFFGPEVYPLAVPYLCLFDYSYSSGGEDGYVRVHTFDPAYFDFDFEY